MPHDIPTPPNPLIQAAVGLAIAVALITALCVPAKLGVPITMPWWAGVFGVIWISTFLMLRHKWRIALFAMLLTLPPVHSRCS